MTVTISRGLTERLAGVKNLPDEDKKRHKRVSKADREALALLHEREEIRESLLRSRRIGSLLLKREEEELSKINTQIKELTQHPAMQPPCRDICHQQRAAVEKCCQDHPGSVLQCASLIDAYANCTNKIFMQHVTAPTKQQIN